MTKNVKIHSGNPTLPATVDEQNYAHVFGRGFINNAQVTITCDEDQGGGEWTCDDVKAFENGTLLVFRVLCTTAPVRLTNGDANETGQIMITVDVGAGDVNEHALTLSAVFNA